MVWSLLLNFIYHSTTHSTDVNQFQMWLHGEKLVTLYQILLTLSVQLLQADNK